MYSQLYQLLSRNFLPLLGMPQRHNSDSSVTSSHNGGGQNGQQQNGQQYMRYRSKYPPRRPYWSNTPVPPRFERSNAKHYPDIDQDSSCETEELPNGFTKVSSTTSCFHGIFSIIFIIIHKNMIGRRKPVFRVSKKYNTKVFMPKGYNKKILFSIFTDVIQYVIVFYIQKTLEKTIFKS